MLVIIQAPAVLGGIQYESWSRLITYILAALNEDPGTFPLESTGKEF